MTNTEIPATDVNTLQPREAYMQRRAAVEEYFLHHPPKQETIDHQDGATVRVLSECCLIPKELKKPHLDTLRISVYVPGLFEVDKPNYGNHPLEVKLLGAMLTGSADAVVMLKGEGLNALAYETNDGRGHGQQLVASDAVDVLKEHVARVKRELDMPADTKVVFEIAGYSEGSTQGASIALQILTKQLGEVAAYTTIGGAGLVGGEDQTKTNVIQSIKRSAAQMTQSDRQEPFIKESESRDSVFVNRKLMGDADQGGLEYALGKAEVSTPADVRNIGKWTIRYVKSLLGFAEEVPYQRLQAGLSKNADYGALVDHDVPIVVFSCTGDVFFPNQEVEKNVNDLRDNGGEVLLVTTNAGHDFAHNHPSGVAFALQLFRDRLNI